MRSANVDDKLAGSHDYLTIMAVATTGWLMHVEAQAASAALAAGQGDPAFYAAKLATTRFFIDRIVPEALGRHAGAVAGADGLYSLTAAALSA